MIQISMNKIKKIKNACTESKNAVKKTSQDLTFSPPYRTIFP